MDSARKWKGKRVLILGAARQGLALARYLSRQGAIITLNDKTQPEKLAAARQSLSNLPVSGEGSVRWVLGEHPLELLDDVVTVFLSGGVPLTLPIVIEANRRNLPLSNDSQVFMEAAPCQVIGITGSAGKTTTTTLVGRMAEASINPPKRAWIGGNIGLPLIDLIDQIKPEDTVILELSSFQLEQMTTMPQVGAILNITPNHLDRHGTLEAYTAAKARLLDFQTENDTAILGREDPGAWQLRDKVRGKLVTFGITPPVDDMVGTYFENGDLFLKDQNGVHKIMSEEMIQVRGRHNLVNVLAACAITYVAFGNNPAAMMTGIKDFQGVPHRLEFVRQYHGALWYNDSIATAPERTMAAIQSFSEPLVLMLGGRDKNLPWEDLADLVCQRVDHLIIFGEAAKKIHQSIAASQTGSRPYTIECVNSLEKAIQAAARVASPGDVVLLSPGGTSYDEFKDFEERGERFRRWVHNLS